MVIAMDLLSKDKPSDKQYFEKLGWKLHQFKKQLKKK